MAQEAKLQQQESIISIEKAGVDSLRKDAMSNFSVLYISLAGAAPIAAMMFNVPLMAGQAGASTPLAFLLSGLGMVAFAFVIMWFARRYSAAGGFYNFVSHALPRPVAFQAGWLMLGGYAVTEAALMSAFGAFSATAIEHYLGWKIPWMVLALAGAAILFLVSYSDVSWSVWAMVPFLILEVAVLVILDLVITAKGGAAGHDLLHTFSTAGAAVEGASPGGLGGILLAMALGIQTWIGFEGGAVYGEEAKNPRKAIPFALFGSVIFLLVLYCWTSYSAVIGFGWERAVDTLAANPDNAFYMLADQFVPWLRPFMTVAITTSALACGLAFHNGMVRYFYAMGREGILPKPFGKTHPKFKSPYVAIMAQSALTVFVLVLFGGLLAVEPMPLYGYLAVTGAISLIFVYILVNVCAFKLREKSTSSNIINHVLVPAFATLLILMPLVSFFYPVPAWPLNILPYIVIGWIVLGAVFAAIVAAKYPDRWEILGKIARQED